jgi:hypothetical protein
MFGNVHRDECYIEGHWGGRFLLHLLAITDENSHQATNSHRSIYETSSLHGFRNAYQVGIPAFFHILTGTAEAVLYRRPIHETSPRRAPGS